MKILITGGTGFIGRNLAARLWQDGHHVSVLTRRSLDSRGGQPYHLQGDPLRPGPWQDAVAEQDAVVNLAGASVFGRWTKKRKQLLTASRILTTRHLVEALPPQAPIRLVSGSAVGFYGPHGDEELDESEKSGQGFLAWLCRHWEKEAREAEKRGARVALARIGIVLGRDGGALKQLARQVRLFVGGRMGSGRQWISWIHMKDLVGALVHLITRPDLVGPFNLVAPHPVRNHELVATLGKILHRPSWLPVPGFVLTTVLGEFASMLLDGQRAVPKGLLENGFSFHYSELEAALRHLLGS